jgi:hypothetical protein
MDLRCICKVAEMEMGQKHTNTLAVTCCRVPAQAYKVENPGTGAGLLLCMVRGVCTCWSRDALSSTCTNIRPLCDGCHAQ